MVNRIGFRSGRLVAISVVVAGALGMPSVNAGAPTAKEALQALGQRVGPAYAASVVQVIGVRGVDQPPVWRILAQDPYRRGVVRDFTVQNGQVVNDQLVPPAYLARVPVLPIPTDGLRTDSSRAFVIADHAAHQARVGFDSLDYEARASDPATGPIWIVRLNDQRGLVVGEVLIRASNGVVLRQQWFPGGIPSDSGALAGGSSRPAGRPSTAESGIAESVAEGWEVAKDSVSKGSTAVKSGVVKAGGAIREFFGEVFEAEANENPGTPYQVPTQPQPQPGSYY
ncbi:hypothetical protein BH23VER1_BH23VER1_17640 [soil metagenome]